MKPNRHLPSLAELKESGVSAENALRLWDALRRLLAGTHDPLLSSGHLTITNLARQAGVGRATANRAVLILAEFRRQKDLIDSDAVTAQNPTERVKQLERALERVRGESSKEITYLRGSIRVLAQQVQVLSLELNRARSAAQLPRLDIKRN